MCAHHSRVLLPASVYILLLSASILMSYLCKYVCTLKQLILVMAATNAISERSFSVMLHVKSYLWSTMRQQQLNHVMVLNIYKEQLEKVDLIAVANEFVGESEHRKRFFGTFT